MFLVGLDPFREGLLNPKSSSMAEWVQGDVMALPFRQHFDAVGRSRQTSRFGATLMFSPATSGGTARNNLENASWARASRFNS